MCETCPSVCACVREYRLATVRGGDGKYRAAFERVSDELGAAGDNVYMRLDKHTAHLATALGRHPDLLVAVLRRASSSKPLVDVHAFVCESAQHALGIVDHVRLLHARSAPYITFSDASASGRKGTAFLHLVRLYRTQRNMQRPLAGLFPATAPASEYAIGFRPNCFSAAAI